MRPPPPRSTLFPCTTLFRSQHPGHRRPGRLADLDSPVRHGREHDTTALRTHPEALPLLPEWTDTDHAVRADLRYEGERTALTTDRTSTRLNSSHANISYAVF